VYVAPIPIGTRCSNHPSDEIEDFQRVTVCVLAVTLDPIGGDDKGRVLTRNAGETDPVALTVRDHVETTEF
jgi:hypothetical protein